jgi:hypothetical protein
VIRVLFVITYSGPSCVKPPVPFERAQVRFSLDLRRRDGNSVAQLWRRGEPRLRGFVRPIAAAGGSICSANVPAGVADVSPAPTHVCDQRLVFIRLLSRIVGATKIPARPCRVRLPSATERAHGHDLVLCKRLPVARLVRVHRSPNPRPITFPAASWCGLWNQLANPNWFCARSATRNKHDRGDRPRFRTTQRSLTVRVDCAEITLIRG